MVQKRQWSVGWSYSQARGSFNCIGGNLGCCGSQCGSSEHQCCDADVKRNVLCLSFHDTCQSSLAILREPEVWRSQAPPTVGVTLLVLCTKDCPLLGQLNFSHLFPFEKRHYVKYDCCRPIKVEWGILNLSFSVLGKMPVILSLRFPGRINKDFSSAW